MPVRGSVTEILAIFGPTASGKTAVAQALTRRIPAELVSADSMQVYRGLPILTNQSPARLVGIWPLDHEASVADLTLPPAPEPGERERWEQLYNNEGAERAHERLAELDPEAAASVHPNDRRRVVRSLELAGLDRERNQLWTDEARHPTIIFGLDVPKDELDRRIDERARAMFRAGVREEVRQALAGAISSTARYAHGLDDIAENPDDEAAIAALAARTRRYAAYQRKWMRRIPGLVSLPANRPPGEIADAILEVARARQRLPAGRAG